MNLESETRLSHEFFGALSGALVAISAIPYLMRVLQRKISPQLSSWGLWAFIGFAILLTYGSESKDWSAIPAIFGFINPTLVIVAVLWIRSRRLRAIQERGKLGLLLKLRRKTSLKWYEWLCLIAGAISLALWLRYQGSSEHSHAALYTAIAADVCAVIPTMIFVVGQPKEERPFPWLLFGVGYAFAIPAVTLPSWANYALPVYMTFGTFAIATPIVMYCLRSRTPLRKWI